MTSVALSSSNARQALEVLAGRLREIRVDAGLTARALAQQAGWHDHSKVSKIEHARQMPSPADIRTWCESCNALDQVADLVSSAGAIESMYVEWRRLQRTGLRRHQEAAIPLYQDTHQFRIYEPGVIPGLLQTFDYAKALMGAITSFRGIRNDAEEAAKVRLERQRVLTEGDRRLVVLLEETALHSRVADGDVMIAQLDRLLTLSQLPRISLGIIPMTAERQMWPVEGFWIFDDKRVLVELTTAEVAVTQPREIAVYAKAFLALAETASYGNSARKLIGAAISSMGTKGI